MSEEPKKVVAGLDGVVATATALSSVDGENGELILAGYRVDELAPMSTFEDSLHLLWHGHLPDRQELEALSARLSAARPLSPMMLEFLRSAARTRIAVIDGLRTAVSMVSPAGDDRPESLAVLVVGAIPSIIAAYWRLLEGAEPIAAPRGGGHVEAFLTMLRGESPSAPEVRALNTYFNTVIDHGMNASTFTARVIISTQSDVVSAVTGAIGALKGPLHGGAPGPVLEMLLEIGDGSRAEKLIRRKLAAGERLMGFGHRIYKVRDPRADVLAAAAKLLGESLGETPFLALATTVESTALQLLEEAKPGRRLQTNVEFYTAILLHSLGLEPELFTPLFAAARSGGWTAHAFEQLREGRLIRPQSVYVGPRDLKWKR